MNAVAKLKACDTRSTEAGTSEHDPAACPVQPACGEMPGAAAIGQIGQAHTRASLAPALELLADAAIIISESGGILFANSALGDILGYDKASVVGQSVEMLMPERDRSGHHHFVDGFFKRARRMSMSTRPSVTALSAMGEDVPVSISLSGFEMDGEPVALALIRDAKVFQRRLVAARAKTELDALTGIGNRLLFTRRLQAMLKTAAPFALLYLDLQKFKSFNDRFGHQVGDEVLRIVAERINSAIRADDVAVRLGGDEFALLVSGIGHGQLLQSRIDSIAQSLSRPMRIAGVSGGIGANIGAACFPDDGESEETLVAVADKRMYRAKKLGVPHSSHAAGR